MTKFAALKKFQTFAKLKIKYAEDRKILTEHLLKLDLKYPGSDFLQLVILQKRINNTLVKLIEKSAAQLV